jgi:hypothetical protein
MDINEELTRIIRGRVIRVVTKEEGLVTIVFADHSTLRLRVAGGPTENLLGDGKIGSVAEDGAELILSGEDGRTAVLQLAAPGSSITLTDKEEKVEYSG